MRYRSAALGLAVATLAAIGLTAPAEARPLQSTSSTAVAATKVVTSAIQWGQNGDVAVPRSYVGDSRLELAVFRPSNGTWYIRGWTNIKFGQAGDIPVPADYNGDGRAELAVFRPSNGYWYIRGVGQFVWGQAGDVPAASNYVGDSRAEAAVWRPSLGRWFIRGAAQISWGANGDIPAPADYVGDSHSDLAVFRPSLGRWFIRGAAQIAWGANGDVPAAANFVGNAKADLTVFRRGVWFIRGAGTVTWGQNGDRPYAGNYAGTTATDQGVWRPSNGTWYLRYQVQVGPTCDPSYPTVCIKPPPPDLDCNQISYRNFKVIGADPHGFDSDNDGVGCESGSTPPPPTRPGCDPSYPTVCIAPPPPDLDCPQIPYRNFRVVGADPHRFDSDNDGIGCES
jgi:hypothetical protein